MCVSVENRVCGANTAGYGLYGTESPTPLAHMMNKNLPWLYLTILISGDSGGLRLLAEWVTGQCPSALASYASLSQSFHLSGTWFYDRSSSAHGLVPTPCISAFPMSLPNLFSLLSCVWLFLNSLSVTSNWTLASEFLSVNLGLKHLSKLCPRWNIPNSNVCPNPWCLIAPPSSLPQGMWEPETNVFCGPPSAN